MEVFKEYCDIECVSGCDFGSHLSGATSPRGGALSHLPPQSTLSGKTLFESASLAYCSTLTDIRDILTGQGSGLKIVTFQPSRRPFPCPWSCRGTLPTLCVLSLLSDRLGASSASFMKFGTRRRGSVQGLRLEDLSWWMLIRWTSPDQSIVITLS